MECRASGPAPARRATRRSVVAHARHVVDRHDDLEVELLARAGVDDLDLAADPAQEARDRRERPLRRRQADALRVGVGQVLEALEAQRQVGAALGGGHRVDLVDDHVLDAAQDLARLAGEQQVERLGRGDEDVRRVAASWRRASAGVSPVRLATLISGTATPMRSAVRRMPASGDAQVALDVVGERLERADVQHAQRSCAPAASSAISRSRHHRNAARVLPLPVGAWISVWRPPLIAAQPSSWAGVGSANVSANQVRVGSLNAASGSTCVVGAGLTA